MSLDPFLSSKFKFWSFISMVLLVFVHGYNLEMRYLQPWTTPWEPLTITSFTEYWLANGLLRFRIPMLFIISGYLYALHDHAPYGPRTKKRVRTLLVPYIIWSAFGIGLSFALELFPYTRHLIVDSQVLMISDNRSTIHDYYWYEVLARWIFFPVSYQLWFIRVLLVYNIAYPLICRWVTKKVPSLIFFSFVFLLWLGTFGIGLAEGEGLLFFSLGVWMQKKEFSITTPPRWLKPAVWGPVFFLVATGKTILAFYGSEWLGNSVYPVIAILHKLTVVSGLIFCWYGLDHVVQWCMNRSWFLWLSGFSFMIYVMHAPLVAYLINGMFEWLNYMPGYRMITFIFLPTLIITFIILLATVFRRVAPGFYSICTGGRGLAIDKKTAV